MFLSRKVETQKTVKMGKELSIIGKSPEMIGAREKVTGKARFTIDMKLPRMLYAKILRSPHPHAKILKINTSKAELVKGVEAVLTHKEAKIVFAQGRAMNLGDE